jgi:hypothetical protein
MNRSGYEYNSEADHNLWRGAVASAIRGKRGQEFLREMLATLDAMPEKKLIAGDLEDKEGSVCSIGAVGKARGVDMSSIDPEDSLTVAGTFKISDALTREISWENDDGYSEDETPEQRYVRMRSWVESQIVSKGEI